MIKRLFWIICLVGFSLNINGQSMTLPNTNIYQFTFTNTDGNYSLRYPKFLTGFNKDGYNNQPHFASDFNLYIASDYSDNGSVEIVHLNLFEKEFYKLSDTKEMEFSPTTVNQNVISTVRVEADEKTQTLTLYKADMSSPAKRILPRLGNVGYHCWLNEKEVALFLVDEINTLAIANIYDESKKEVASYVGRTLKKTKDGNLLFIDKSLGSKWFIKSLNVNNYSAKVIAETLPNVEDFELLNDGTIICGKGSNLYFHKPGKSVGWTVIKNLEEYGISNISRIAVRKNKLVLVNTETE